MVFVDTAVQGPWPDIQQRLHQRLVEAVAAGQPVIVDATHAKRSWRLAKEVRSSPCQSCRNSCSSKARWAGC